MNFYKDFPKKTYEEVVEILEASDHQSVLNHIVQNGDEYVLNKPIDKISPLPTYHFAIACTVASLGNPQLANTIHGSPERVVEPGWGDNISRELARKFMR